MREPSVETLSSLGGQQDEQFVDLQHPQSVLSRVQVRSFVESDAMLGSGENVNLKNQRHTYKDNEEF